MKKKTPPLAKLRRHAWCGFICGWLIAAMFLVLAAASLQLRSRAHRYWESQAIEQFRQDCLATCASSPEAANRFESFCKQFAMAADIAQTFMGFFAFFAIVVSGLSIGHAIFSREVLKQLKQEEVHNQASQPIAGKPGSG